MSYAAHRKDFAGYTTGAGACGANPAAKAGFWQRLLKALGYPRQSQVDRQIGRFIAGRGGHLTDALERDLIRHMAALPHYWRMRL
jgi:hypothetical protein